MRLQFTLVWQRPVLTGFKELEDTGINKEMKTFKTLPVHVHYARLDDHTRKANGCEGITRFCGQSAQLLGPPPKRCQQLPACYKQLIRDLKQKQQTPTNNRWIESNNKTTTSQSMELLSLDHQSQHNKTDQLKTTTRGINTII